MTMLEQAAYWNEWTESLVLSGFSREEAVAMVTTQMCTQMWIQFAKAQERPGS